MRIVVSLVLALLLVVLAAMAWQHFRYLDWRRNVIHDRQPLLYPAEALHVLTLVRLEPGEPLIETLREVRRETEGRFGGRWIYAGQAAFPVLHSEQLGEIDWDGVVLEQYPSRAAWDDAAATPEFGRAWGRFAQTHAHGMKRPAVPNLVLPFALLGVRVSDVLRGVRPPDPHATANPEALAQLQAHPRVRAAAPYGKDAIVIINLQLDGSQKEQAADASYSRKMLGTMAAGAHGPAHIGDAVTLTGDARFDRIVNVYYPGLDYFHHLITSEFYAGIFGDKQLGDTLSMLTVPILDRI